MLTRGMTRLNRTKRLRGNSDRPLDDIRQITRRAQSVVCAGRDGALLSNCRVVADLQRMEDDNEDKVGA